MRNWSIRKSVSALIRSWGPHIEPALPGTEMESIMERSSIPSFGFFFMLALSASIAALGLIANSAPAIIGAMIIAPLMGPIISFAYGLVSFKLNLIGRSFFTVLAGAAVVVAFAYFGSTLFGLRIAGSEILSRASPTLIDLGIALAAGGAGAFSHTRQSIASTIAGAAIAVALVPPLAVCGIGLSLGEKAVLETGEYVSAIGFIGGGYDLAAGAFILFLTNFVGIVAVAVLIFAVQRYGKWKRALLILIVMVGLVVPLVQPLREEFQILYVKNRVARLLAILEQTRPDIVGENGRLLSLHVGSQKGQIYVEIEGFEDNRTIANAQDRVDLFLQYLTQEIGQEVKLQYRIIAVDEIKIFQSSATTKKTPAADAKPESSNH